MDGMEQQSPQEALKSDMVILADLMSLYKKERTPNESVGERAPESAEITEFIVTSMVPNLTKINNVNEKGEIKNAIDRQLKGAGISMPVDLLHA